MINQARHAGMVLATFGTLVTGTVFGQDEVVGPVEVEVDRPGAENTPALDEMTPELDEAVRKGLSSLAIIQNADGSFGRGRYGKHVGITALCALAFMADGHLPDRGRYGTVVSKALQFVLDNATETGLLAAETSHGPMYGH